MQLDCPRELLGGEVVGRYTNSLEYLARARKVTPGGAQTLSKMAARFPEGAFPVALRRGQGAKVTDLDGNDYVDWICGLGAITLGYRNIDVQGAITVQAGEPCYSLPGVLEATVAERLCQKIPCAEMVRFVNSGSEATEAAIRTARIATGRDVILTVKNGYHSWHSWFQAVKDWHPGVPKDHEKLIMGVRYNDVEQLEEVFDSQQFAAFILEPALFDAPVNSYLEEARDICNHHGTLLIFDEVVCGGRWAYGGGQEYFGVTPDLATFGKGLANGLPIGILCGKWEYMQHAELISGTFGGNALSLAALNAVLDVYEREPVIETMWRRGKELQEGFNDFWKSLRVDERACQAIADGYPCKPRFRFIYAGTAIHNRAMSLFLQVAAEHGALFHPGGFNVCYALTDADMATTFQAIGSGLEAVAKAVTTGDWSPLTGKLCQPVVTVRQ